MIIFEDQTEEWRWKFQQLMLAQMKMRDWEELCKARKIEIEIDWKNLVNWEKLDAEAKWASPTSSVI